MSFDGNVSFQIALGPGERYKVDDLLMHMHNSIRFDLQGKEDNS